MGRDAVRWLGEHLRLKPGLSGTRLIRHMRRGYDMRHADLPSNDGSASPERYGNGAGLG